MMREMIFFFILTQNPPILIKWVSITDDFCRYLLDNREKINKIFKNSIASDELLCQTMAYNSEFREQIYDENDLKKRFNEVYRLEKGKTLYLGQG